MSHFIYSSTGRHLDCFHFLPLMMNAAETIYAQVHFIVFALLKNTCLSFLAECELLTMRVGVTSLLFTAASPPLSPWLALSKCQWMNICVLSNSFYSSGGNSKLWGPILIP